MPSVLKFSGSLGLTTFRKEGVWQAVHFCEHICACVAAHRGVKHSAGCLLTYCCQAVLGITKAAEAPAVSGVCCVPVTEESKGTREGARVC